MIRLNGLIFYPPFVCWIKLNPGQQLKNEVRWEPLASPGEQFLSTWGCAISWAFFLAQGFSISPPVPTSLAPSSLFIQADSGVSDSRRTYRLNGLRREGREKSVPCSSWSSQTPLPAWVRGTADQVCCLSSISHSSRAGLFPGMTHTHTQGTRGLIHSTLSDFQLFKIPSRFKPEDVCQSSFLRSYIYIFSLFL